MNQGNNNRCPSVNARSLAFMVASQRMNLRDPQGIHYFLEPQNHPQVRYHENELFDVLNLQDRLDLQSADSQYELRHGPEPSLPSREQNVMVPTMVEEMENSQSPRRKRSQDIEKVIKRRNRSRLSAQEKRLFNNMPGFTIGTLQNLIGFYKYDGLQKVKIEYSTQVQKCFYQLVRVLLKLSSKDGTRAELRMLLNNVVPQLHQELKLNQNLNDAQAFYLEILDFYGERNYKIINLAKWALKRVIQNTLTITRMSREAKRREFDGPEEKIRRQVFEKYLIQFRKQLQAKKIQFCANRKQVLGNSIFLE